MKRPSYGAFGTTACGAAPETRRTRAAPAERAADSSSGQQQPSTPALRHCSILFRLPIADRFRLEREVRQQLFHLRVVLRGIHRRLHQPQRGNLPLDRVPLLDERADRRIAGVDLERAPAPAPETAWRPAGPFTPSSIVACSVSSSPFCSNAFVTFDFAYSNASAIETWPLRSRSAASSLKASTKYSGNRVSFRSPPVFVAVTTTRPGAATVGRKAPLELAVLTNATRCDGTCRAAGRIGGVRSGPGRLKAAWRPSKLPWPISRIDDGLVRSRAGGEIGQDLLDGVAGRAALDERCVQLRFLRRDT